MCVLYMMDIMIKDEKDKKDLTAVLDLSLKDKTLSPTSYTKTNKLITALYMVTDTIDKEEPIRLKLRTLGIEILSDSTSLQKGILGNLDGKINIILSFLNIASDVGMFSEMNCNILKKEFIELKQSIQGFRTQNHLWLEEFILRPEEINSSIGPANNVLHSNASERSSLSFKKRQGTRIGVQKGSTLLKALDKVEERNNSFEILKNKRRETILEIIKNKPNGVSIKDIIVAIRALGEETGEKTLQRELVSMIKDNVLKKTGEKRWSQYFLN